ncbi:hypothetical protein [Hymenobacter wooponensis]|uniref:Uncharacterized protein n=1 Tax=Hymenobacter wooponensis TaxID=1525360 RepID=A0A4Z0MJR6_9BACT|nr:hypothetical protein [Hymenobacter wooponensis]TGD79761.1 hypothetical protein EU557_16235 [Hymenobacter wooponensis]
MRLNRYAFVLLGVLPVALVSCMGTQSAVETAAVVKTRPAKSAQPVAVDVAQLIGLSIDELRQVLGPAHEASADKRGLEPTAEQLRLTNGEGWINTFDHNGQTIVVAFHARTRKVRDIVLVGPNEEELMQRGNISLTSPHYIVLPFTESDSSEKVAGLRIVARN